MRLFAAVWPPEDVLDHLDLALGAVRRTLPGDGTGPVRWSARDTWHLTCAFYGDVPDGRVADLPIATCEIQGYAYDARLRTARVAREIWGDTHLADRLERDAAALRERGVPTAVYYPVPLHRQAAYSRYPTAPRGLPVTEAKAAAVISLPMHPYLSDADQDLVVNAVREFVKKSGA